MKHVLDGSHEMKWGLGGDTDFILRLNQWHQNMDPMDKEIIGKYLGYTWELLVFPLPTGFLEGFLSRWDPHNQVLRVGSQELMPTLEEIQTLTKLKLNGSHARVTVGNMVERFANVLGLRHKAIRSKLVGSHTLPLSFLEERFSSTKGFHKFASDFQTNVDATRWKEFSKRALIICILAIAYFPDEPKHFDVGISSLVLPLLSGQTIIPIILAETLGSLSHCAYNPTHRFRGSLPLLYMWTIAHVLPPNNRSGMVKWVEGNKMDKLRIKPRRCTNKESWIKFFEEISQEDLNMETGLSPPTSYRLHVLGHKFIPLVGIRRMVAYTPSLVAAQFGHYQRTPILEENDFHQMITPNSKKLMEEAYKLWETVQIAQGEAMKGSSMEYKIWLGNRESAWKKWKARPSSSSSSSTIRIPDHRKVQVLEGEFAKLEERLEEKSLEAELAKGQLKEVTRERNELKRRIDTVLASTKRLKDGLTFNTMRKIQDILFPRDD